MTKITPPPLYVTMLPEVKSLEEGAISLYDCDNHYLLVCVESKVHEYFDRCNNATTVYGSAIYLVPSGDVCVIRAVGEDVRIISMGFKAHTNLCGGVCPSLGKGSRLRLSKLMSQAEAPPPTSTRIRPRRTSPKATSLVMKRDLEVWLEGVKTLMEHMDVDIKYYDYKLEELFLLIKKGYSKEEVESFMRFYHCRIEGFREKIMEIMDTKTSVSDLYAVGTRMGLNELAFKRTFAEEFSQSPREWLSEQRARMIYKELILTDKPFKELSDDYGFCSVSHFGAFCKQNLGETPLHIRKSIQL